MYPLEDFIQISYNEKKVFICLCFFFLFLYQDQTEEATIIPDVEIHNILISHSVEEIGAYADQRLQELRTSIYDHLPPDNQDVQIQLYLLRHRYQIGSGKTTIVINITNDTMEVKVRRPMGCFSSIVDKIKEWVKSIIKFFS